MFLLQSFLVALLCARAFCEECVTFGFGEEEFYEEFDDNAGLCAGVPGNWKLGYYSNTTIPSPHELSTSFITSATNSSTSLNCVSSFAFPMTINKAVEVNIYIDWVSIFDYVEISIVNELSNPFAPVGLVYLNLMSPDIVKGWNTVTVPILMGSSSFNGYVTFVSSNSPGSTVIIDSFRYIPQSFEGECNIYEDDVTEPAVPEEETETADTDCEKPGIKITVEVEILLKKLCSSCDYNLVEQNVL